MRIEANLAVSLSQMFFSEGKVEKRPKTKRMRMAKLRRRLALIPVAFTRALSPKVARVKLKTKPRTMPSGRRLLLPVPPAKIIGNRGRMQGERMVTIPARKEKTSKINILIKIA